MVYKRFSSFFLIIIIVAYCPWLILNGEAFEPVNVRVGLFDIQIASGKEPDIIELKALRRIFEGLGIPYDLLNNTSRLKKYRVICTGGSLINSIISAEVTNALYDYVEMGGVLVAAGKVENRMNPLFGISEHIPSKRRYRLSFKGEDSSLLYIDHPNERTISLGNGEDHFYDEVIWSHGYTLSRGSLSLGVFDDGSCGFLMNRYGRGRAYLLGLTYTESVLQPQIGKDYEAQRRYVNSHEPSADVVMLILKAIYEANYSPFVSLSTAPYSKPTALILSHDIDAQTSFVDSLKFADLEEQYGVTSTFFENTKYFANWMDIDYYNIEENVEAIRKLKKRGFDIGSHTVSHYKKFASVPEGDPKVTFDSYDPLNRITVHGEVRVSKELLDRDIPGQDTIAFRAGDLEYPYNLIRILEGAGYLYDSTYSANDVLTALPFLALKERELGSPESNVFEIPVTLDDSLGYLTPENVDLVVRKWLDVVRTNMNNETITVLLIHPSDTRTKTYKLEAQEKLMRGVLEMDCWMGDLTTFGEFWRDRHTTSFNTYLNNKDSLVIEVKGRSSDLNPAIGFVVGNTEVKTVVVKDGTGLTMNYIPKRRNNKIYLGRKRKSIP